MSEALNTAGEGRSGFLGAPIEQKRSPQAPLGCSLAQNVTHLLAQASRLLMKLDGLRISALVRAKVTQIRESQGKQRRSGKLARLANASLVPGFRPFPIAQILEKADSAQSNPGRGSARFSIQSGESGFGGGTCARGVAFALKGPCERLHRVRGDEDIH